MIFGIVLSISQGISKRKSRNYMSETQKPSDKDHRQKITVHQAKSAALTAESKLMDRLNEKGYGVLVSRHEILGVLTEEYHEAVKAVESQSLKEVRSELVDLAVGCIFGIACIDAKAVDW